jgi:hypothetical protein
VRHWTLVGLAVCLAPSVSADRLIDTFTGKRLPVNSVRGEWRFVTDRPERNVYHLGLGISQQFEAELVYSALGERGRATTFNFAYNYLSPVADLVPGISFGVRDGLDRTDARRAFYVAATLRSSIDSAVITAPLEFTIGGQTRQGLFLGVMLPFADQLRWLTEYEAKKVTAGFELRPIPRLALRWIFAPSGTMLGVSYLARL